MKINPNTFVNKIVTINFLIRVNKNHFLANKNCF